MGDMADWIIEQGQEQYLAHLEGRCEFGCIYCLEEGNYGGSGK